jgi:signal transduction histidine kinase/FixJ family two-component response regulator
VSWSLVTRQIHGVDNNYVPDIENGILFYKSGKSREKILTSFNDAISKGKSWDEELQIINCNGDEVWVRVVGDVHFQNGKCINIFGTFQDITSRKIAELEIAASRNLLQNVLQAASEVSIISTTTEGIITVFNKGAEKLSGYSASEVIGIHSPAIIHRSDEVIARGKELSAQHNMEISGFRVFVHNPEIIGSEQREWTYVRKDGSEFIVSLVVTAIRKDDGEILGYLGIATDISERKQAEQELINQKAKLSAFVSHAPAAVAMFDTEVRYIAYSNRWKEEYKIPNKDIVGISHYDIFPNIGSEWKQIHQRSLKGEVIRNEEDVWRPLGWTHDQYLRWEVRPWFRHDNTIGGIMMMSQDITDVCMQREELRKAKVVAEQASKAKSEFLSNMSHEIRTPLNGVIGFTDLILKTQLTETQHHYLTIVNQSANGLLSIINDILDFSKIEAGKLELDITKCNLYELTAQAIDIISYQVQNKGLEMLLNVATDLPGYLWTDNIRLKQVLVNLLGNSMKFTEKGEIELKVVQLPIPPQKDGKIVIRFEVRDTGIGIPSDKQEKIFEAFSQEDASTTRRYGGTGLGLTISNSLLRLMGSKLQLISAPGEGSTFFFDIRVRTENGGIEAPHAIAAIKKVLIVDDNDHNRTILSHMLAYNEILTDEAKNGFDAMQLLASGAKYDVILMDYHMPYMDGLETIKKIRESFGKQGEDQSFILLHSSSDDEIIIKACRDLHIMHRLLKPIKFYEIYDLLSKTTIKSSSVEPLVKTKQVNKKTDLRVMVVEDNPINMLLAKAIIKKIVPDSIITEATNGQDAVSQCTSQILYSWMY